MTAEKIAVTILKFCHTVVPPKHADRTANNVDPDQ